MRIMKSAMVALVAVFAFAAMTAGNASAFHPLFLNVGGQTELLFHGLAPDPTLRAIASSLGSVLCEHVVFHGFALNKSTLAHRVHFSFLGKCVQKVGTVETACSEPILPKLSLAELGLLVLPNGKKDVAILIAPSEGTTFVTIKCGLNETTVEGAIVGAFPEVNKKLVNQYNKSLTEGEVVFRAANGTETQEFTTIELLGANMTKAELTVSGFFKGKASEEGTGIIESGGIEICTKEPANCP